MWAYALHFFDWPYFPSVLMNSSVESSGIWDAQGLLVWNWSLSQWTVFLLEAQTDREREREISCLTAALIRCIAGYPQEMRTPDSEEA